MENTIKPKRRTRAATAAAANNTTPTSPAAVIIQMPTQEELTALYNSLPIEERNKLLAESKIKPAISAAFNSLLIAFASIGKKFKDPVIILGTDPGEDDAKNGEDEPVVFISPDGTYEEENDEDEEDEDEEISSKKLIKALKEMMEEEKLSQSDVADKLKLSQGTVSNWLGGFSEPRNGNAKKLAKFVNHYID